MVLASNRTCEAIEFSGFWLGILQHMIFCEAVENL